LNFNIVWRGKTVMRRLIILKIELNILCIIINIIERILRCIRIIIDISGRVIISILRRRVIISILRRRVIINILRRRVIINILRRRIIINILRRRVITIILRRRVIINILRRRKAIIIGIGVKVDVNIRKNTIIINTIILQYWKRGRIGGI
jgi:hypothetical protein